MQILFRNNQSVYTSNPRLSLNLHLSQGDAVPAQAPDVPPAAPVGDESEEEIEVSDKAASRGLTAVI